MVLIFLALLLVPARAQTMAQIDACRGDAIRLCPNSTSIASARVCLMAHKSQVSRACKEVAEK
jgi:hypothetical protein